ncbi:hypothetical protein P879_04555 [Paragonimus westermani]|uniref:Ig-like domain-containing protein n=1 Tax=Paragonimus westermani TaxID=34504 RepID=A0A8T0DC88_9TREM|nr:hypothetical protein P879_04555 [Paragonimus westermani]
MYIDPKLVYNLFFSVPPTIRMTNNKIGQLLHRTTMVRAVITGNPINSFYWEFERRPIYGPNSNCLIPMPNDKYCVLVDKFNAIQREVKTTLFITNLTKHDYGLYTCVVETPFGIFRNSTEVFRTHPTHASPWENQYLRVPNMSDLKSASRTFEKHRTRPNENMNKRETYLVASGSWRDKPQAGQRSYVSNFQTCRTPPCDSSSYASTTYDPDKKSALCLLIALFIYH